MHDDGSQRSGPLNAEASACVLVVSGQTCDFLATAGAGALVEVLDVTAEVDQSALAAAGGVALPDVEAVRR